MTNAASDREAPWESPASPEGRRGPKGPRVVRWPDLSEVRRFWLRELPRVVSAWAPGVSDVFADGAWTWSWRPVAALGPLVGLALGFVAPLAGLVGPAVPPLPFLILTIAGAILGGPTGLSLIVGYAAGSLLHGLPDLARLVAATSGGPIGGVRWAGGWLVGSLLLATPALGFPRISPTSSRPLWIRVPARGQTRVNLQRLVYPVACAVLTYLWSQGMSVLVRPAVTWRGLPLTPDAIAALRLGWPILVAAAFLAAIVRLGLERVATARARGALAVAKARHQVENRSPRPGWRWQRLPVLVRLAVPTGLTTLLLAGACQNWADAGLVALVSLALSAWRAAGAPLPSRVAAILRATPVLARVVVAALAGYVAYFMSHPAGGDATWGVLVSALVALIAGEALLRGRGADRSAPAASSVVPARSAELAEPRWPAVDR